MKLPKARHVAEILVTTAAVWGVERLVVNDPLFSQLWGAPYTLLPAVFGAYYGILGVVLSSTSVALILGAEAILAESFDPIRLSVGILVGGVVAALAVGVRGMLTEQRDTLLARIRAHVGRTRRLERENAVLAEICRELEGRITRERKSLTYLLTKLERIEASTLHEALGEILDAVRTFTGATQASIWRYERAGNHLVLAASSGRAALHTEAARSVDASQGVLGWVARNATPFSFRMAAQSPLFSSWDYSSNLLTYPLRVRDEIWGVLNVEAMPFVAYSRQAETFIEVILKIVERPLRTLVERELEASLEETHPGTGVARSSLLFRRLESELNRVAGAGGRFSLVLLEVSNEQSLRTALGGAGWLEVVSRLAKFVALRNGGSTSVYHYRSDAQLAFLLQDRDSDGTALVCLELLGDLQAQTWRAGETEVSLEIRVGFSTSQHGELSAETLLQRAEDLLRLQETQ